MFLHAMNQGRDVHRRSSLDGHKDVIQGNGNVLILSHERRCQPGQQIMHPVPARKANHGAGLLDFLHAPLVVGNDCLIDTDE